MSGGAWWAAVHGVAKSWTRLSDFTFTFHFHALEGEVLTPGSPGKPLVLVLTCIIFDHSYFYFGNDLGLCLSIVVSDFLISL